MAEETSGTIEIAAPPEEVLEVIADVEAYPEWAGVRSVEVIERDDLGRPVEAAFVVDSGGIKANYTLRYDFSGDGSGVSWSSTDAGGAIKSVLGGYDLENDEGTTIATYRMAVETAVPLPGFMKRKAEKRIVETALQGLKRRVEGE